MSLVRRLWRLIALRWLETDEGDEWLYNVAQGSYNDGWDNGIQWATQDFPEVKDV